MKKPKKKQVDSARKIKGRPIIYTEQFCVKELSELYNILMSDYGKKSIITVHDLLEGRGYSRQRFSEFALKYPKNKHITDTIKNIHNELENRLYKLGLSNKVNVTMAIFSLKNNYGWVDKVVADTNVVDSANDEVIIE